MWVDPEIKMECFIAQIEYGLSFQVERIFDNNWFSFLFIILNMIKKTVNTAVFFCAIVCTNLDFHEEYLHIMWISLWIMAPPSCLLWVENRNQRIPVWFILCRNMLAIWVLNSSLQNEIILIDKDIYLTFDFNLWVSSSL